MGVRIDPDFSSNTSESRSGQTTNNFANQTFNKRSFSLQPVTQIPTTENQFSSKLASPAGYERQFEESKLMEKSSGIMLPSISMSPSSHQFGITEVKYSQKEGERVGGLIAED